MADKLDMRWDGYLHSHARRRRRREYELQNPGKSFPQEWSDRMAAERLAEENSAFKARPVARESLLNE